MKLRSLFSVAAAGVLMTLAACSNEMLQIESSQPELELKDGEKLVTLSLSGTGKGAVSSRAVTDIEAVAGESAIKKLQIYSFVNLTAANPGAHTAYEAGYTLERIYLYEENGTANDLKLTASASGYQVSFGIDEESHQIDPDHKVERMFVLVANDMETRTFTAVPVGTVGSTDRSNATNYTTFTASRTLETGLSDGAANIVAPLPMCAKAQCVSVATGGLSNNYTDLEMSNNVPIAAELTRSVARIDIRNSAVNQFEITGVKLKGIKNSNLFVNLPGITLPSAGLSDFELIDFAEKTQFATIGDVIPAAFYAYPMYTGNSKAAVTIKGKLQSVEVTLTAEFTNDLLPNTRYVVNVYNKAGKMVADISIADWQPGEIVNTGDLAAQLNASATLTATSNATLNGKLLTISHEKQSSDEEVAIILGANADEKPILISVPNWMKVSAKETGTNGEAKYTVRMNKGASERPQTGKISITTYDNAAQKQVVQEYDVYQDYLDITALTGSFSKPEMILIPVLEATTDTEGDVVYAKLPALGGVSIAFMEVDALIPESAAWLSAEKTMQSGLKLLQASSNAGKSERSAIIEVRRYDNSSGGKIITKQIKIVQPGSYTNDQLATTATIQPNQDFMTKRYLRMEDVDGVTTFTLENMSSDIYWQLSQQPMFTIASEQTPISETTFLKCLAVEPASPGPCIFKDRFIPSQNTFSHQVDVYFEPSMIATEDDAIVDFTISTFSNGSKVVKKCRLIIKPAIATPEP